MIKFIRRSFSLRCFYILLSEYGKVYKIRICINVNYTITTYLRLEYNILIFQVLWEITQRFIQLLCPQFSQNQTLYKPVAIGAKQDR